MDIIRLLRMRLMALFIKICNRSQMNTLSLTVISYHAFKSLCPTRSDYLTCARFLCQKGLVTVRQNSYTATCLVTAKLYLQTYEWCAYILMQRRALCTSFSTSALVQVNLNIIHWVGDIIALQSTVIMYY